MIKAITFDLDGVYFINGKTNFIAKLVEMGVSEDEARRVFLRSPEMNEIYKEGDWTDKEYWEWALEQWGLQMNVDQVVQMLIDGYEVDERVVETVKKVRANGYKTLICSNNFPARVNGLQKRFEFLNNFDGAAFSFEVGSTKPDMEIFEALIEKSGVSHEEIVFADDNEENIEGARRAGITALKFQGFDKYIEDLRGLGVNI